MRLRKPESGQRVKDMDFPEVAHWFCDGDGETTDMYMSLGNGREVRVVGSYEDPANYMRGEFVRMNTRSSHYSHGLRKSLNCE